MRKTIFTIGHSTHTLEYFLSLLTKHRIQAVGDHNPQFNREPLMQRLRGAGIADQRRSGEAPHVDVEPPSGHVSRRTRLHRTGLREASEQDRFQRSCCKLRFSTSRLAK
jgi:hypothetical protein